jgi:hypothetical protein
MLRAAALFLVACGELESAVPDAGPQPTSPVDLAGTVDDLAAFGPKHAGTTAGAAAATYIATRFGLAGLDAVHGERFDFPRHDVTRAEASFTVAGAPRAVGFDVLEACGGGHADGPVVAVGPAMPADLAGKELTGAIALVDRVQTYHRSTQYRNVAAAGAAAMIYVSDAPDNLRQVGSVRRTFEELGPIPAISVGADDGLALRAGARATIDVDATATPAIGQNVIGAIAGTLPDEIVVGAHYDTWFAGSTDNGGGVAALIALAERRALEGRPRHTLVFVAYDGEEVALYGGYAFLHTHHEPVAAVLNFETPSAIGASLLGLGRSNEPAFDGALDGAGLRGLYPIYVYMDAVPMLFGGIIPTDIQGIYRSGVPTASTAVANAYYHTVKDTPDQVDTTFLAEVVDRFDAVLGALDLLDAGALATPDPALWRAAATVAESGGRISVSVTVSDASGGPRAGAPVTAALLHDDFFPAGEDSGVTDGAGQVTLDLPAAAGQPRRYVHVTAGPSYPLVETVVGVP